MASPRLQSIAAYAGIAATFIGVVSLWPAFAGLLKTDPAPVVTATAVHGGVAVALPNLPAGIAGPIVNIQQADPATVVMTVAG